MDGKRFLSIRFKLLNPVTVIFGIMIVFAYRGADRLITGIVAELFQEDIVNILELAELCIDPADVAGLRETPDYDPGAGWPAGMKDSRYWNVVDCFDELINYEPNAILSTYYLDEQGQFVVGVDSEVRQDGEPLVFGDVLAPEETLGELVIEGYQDLAFEPTYYEDDTGVYFAGAAPIRDANGDVVGAVLVDLAAGETIENISSLWIYLLILSIVSFVVFAVIIFFLTNQVTASLRKLVVVADRIGEGDYEEVEIGSNMLFADEVGALADRFNEMARQVYKREKKLVQQVTRMKIFIDQDRRKEELDDIVESDFFKKIRDQKEQLNKSKMAKKIGGVED